MNDIARQSQMFNNVRIQRKNEEV